MKVLLRIPAAAPARYLRMQRQDRSFFARTRTGAGKTPRPKHAENPGENLFSQLRSTSMTDHRVRHLVTD
jgi:hypothetical protein